MSDPILISIITPSLNRAAFIEEAIRSVLNQDYPYVEHIIIDGGSTDGTLEILAKFPHLKIISEPDQGLYDAINKGLQLVNGEWLGFLNTDDYYAENIFEEMLTQISKSDSWEAVSGAACLVTDETDAMRHILATYPEIQQGDFLYRATRGASIFNAWFFRRRLFDRLGDFNIRYRYAADRDWLIRLALEQVQYTSLANIVYCYRSHPGSLTNQNIDTGETEFMDEIRSLAENYLSLKSLDEQTHRIFADWHSDITSDQTITALKRRAMQRALHYARDGFQRNLKWPLIFLTRLRSRGYGFINRRIHAK
jgi:glycosyltransferase involved in cell wall biosynthesis